MENLQNTKAHGTADQKLVVLRHVKRPNEEPRKYGISEVGGGGDD